MTSSSSDNGRVHRNRSEDRHRLRGLIVSELTVFIPRSVDVEKMGVQKAPGGAKKAIRDGKKVATFSCPKPHPK